MAELWGDSSVTTIDYVIVWFAPDGDKSRKFRSESAARTFAQTEDVAEWNPLMERRTTITDVKAELIQL